MYAMWRIVVFTLAALRTVKALQEVRPFSDDLSAMSNIELLIPLTASRVETREVDEEDSDEDLQVDRDEPYSAIPAFAFTLDTDPLRGSERAVHASTFPSSSESELIPYRSLYLNSMNQREHTGTIKPVARKLSKQQVDLLKQHKQKGCLDLVQLIMTEARKVILNMCRELVDLLTLDCNCCEEEQPKKKPRSSASMPWFDTIGSKRRGWNTYALADDRDHR